MKCANCKAENQSGNFCMSCGAKLKSQSKTDNEPPLTESDKTDKNLPESEAQEKPTKKSFSKNQKLAAGASALAVVGGLSGYGIYKITNSSSTHSSEASSSSSPTANPSSGSGNTTPTTGAKKEDVNNPSTEGLTGFTSDMSKYQLMKTLGSGSEVVDVSYSYGERIFYVGNTTFIVKAEPQEGSSSNSSATSAPMSSSTSTSSSSASSSDDKRYQYTIEAIDSTTGDVKWVSKPIQGVKGDLKHDEQVEGKINVFNQDGKKGIQLILDTSQEATATSAKTDETKNYLSFLEDQSAKENIEPNFKAEHAQTADPGSAIYNFNPSTGAVMTIQEAQQLHINATFGDWQQGVNNSKYIEVDVTAQPVTNNKGDVVAKGILDTQTKTIIRENKAIPNSQYREDDPAGYEGPLCSYISGQYCLRASSPVTPEYIPTEFIDVTTGQVVPPAQLDPLKFSLTYSSSAAYKDSVILSPNGKYVLARGAYSAGNSDPFFAIGTGTLKEVEKGIKLTFVDNAGIAYGEGHNGDKISYNTQTGELTALDPKDTVFPVGYNDKVWAFPKATHMADITNVWLMPMKP